MSGRKRGEVMAVLKGAAETRKEMFLRFSSDISESLSLIESEGRSVANEKEECKEIFGVIETTDKEIKELEELVARKTGNHYFTDEFNKASLLLGKYEESRKKLTSLYEGLQKTQAEITQEKMKKQDQQRAAAQEKMGTIEGILGRMQYQDPRNPSSKLSAQDFCSKILGKEEVCHPVSEGLEKARQLFAQKKFTEVVEVLGQLDLDIKMMRDTLDKKEIELKEMVQTGIACQNALKESGYSFSTKWIDSGNLSKGIVIEAQDPQKISTQIVNRDGKIELQLQTPEGGCISSVEEIAKSLRVNGFDFLVTHWGSEEGKKKIARSQKANEARKARK
jgi:hypothetical protein